MNPSMYILCAYIEPVLIQSVQCSSYPYTLHQEEDCCVSVPFLISVPGVIIFMYSQPAFEISEDDEPIVALALKA